MTETPQGSTERHRFKHAVTQPLEAKAEALVGRPDKDHFVLPDFRTVFVSTHEDRSWNGIRRRGTFFPRIFSTLVEIRDTRPDPEDDTKHITTFESVFIRKDKAGSLVTAQTGRYDEQGERVATTINESEASSRQRLEEVTDLLSQADIMLKNSKNEMRERVANLMLIADHYNAIKHIPNGIQIQFLETSIDSSLAPYPNIVITRTMEGDKIYIVDLLAGNPKGTDPSYPTSTYFVPSNGGTNQRILLQESVDTIPLGAGIPIPTRQRIASEKYLNNEGIDTLLQKLYPASLTIRKLPPSE